MCKVTNDCFTNSDIRMLPATFKLIAPYTDPELESYQLMLNNPNVYDDTVN